MTQDPAPTQAVIYVRISDDRDGTAAGVGRQEDDSRKMAAQLGWGIGEVLVENDTSAFKRRRVARPNGTVELRVVRPKFRRALELLESGAADGLIAYDLDRTARDPRDLEDLIDVVEQRTPRVPVRSVTGSLRLDNDADVTMARVMVAVANKSSRDTQRRIARKHEQLALEGKFGGGGARRYGYERDGVTLVDAEAAIIREMVQRILDGESARAIVADLTRRQIPTVKPGSAWSTQTLIGILRSGRIAGLREHRGKIVGPAVWPAIVDTATRDQVLAQLELNSRHLGKPGLRFWCNHLIWCSRCGGSLTGSYLGGVHQSAGWRQAGDETAKRYRYWCATNRQPAGCGRIAIAGAQVEAEVQHQVLAYLERDDVVQMLAAATSAASVEETRRLLDDDQRMLDELARAYGERQISLGEWLAARQPVEQRVKVYGEALRAVVPARVRDVLGAADPAAAWGELDATGRRDVTRVVLEAGGHRGWLVAPADQTRARRFDPSRLSLLKIEHVV
jgi:site-specific DNA recombinase